MTSQFHCTNERHVNKLRTVHDRKNSATNASEPRVSRPTIDVDLQFYMVVGHSLQSTTFPAE